MRVSVDVYVLMFVGCVCVCVCVCVYVCVLRIEQSTCISCHCRFSADQADGWRDNGPIIERQSSDYGPPRRDGWGGPKYERRGSYEPARRGSRDIRSDDHEDWSKPLPRNERVER